MVIVCLWKGIRLNVDIGDVVVGDEKVCCSFSFSLRPEAKRGCRGSPLYPSLLSPSPPPPVLQLQIVLAHHKFRWLLIVEVCFSRRTRGSAQLWSALLSMAVFSRPSLSAPDCLVFCVFHSLPLTFFFKLQSCVHLFLHHNPSSPQPTG